MSKPTDLMSDPRTTSFARAATLAVLDLSDAPPVPRPASAPQEVCASGFVTGGQIVFTEANVPDAWDLARPIAPGVEVVLLDPRQDGARQIAACLAGHGIQNLATIDFVVHATERVALGTATSTLAIGSTQPSSSSTRPSPVR